jgi:peptidylprolyl isomerase
MAKAENGQFVQVHYTGTLEDGTIFDSSEGRQPLEFQVGSGSVIPGFENAVLEMDINGSKKIALSSEEAYGPIRDDLRREFPLSILNGDTVEAGNKLWFNSPMGPIQGTVLVVDAQNFGVDFNHPLAGKNLQFQLQLVGISDEPTQQQGCSCSHAASGCGHEPSGCNHC